MPPGDIELGASELEVLTALWDGGPATVREVLNQLHGRGRTVAYTTVLTFLSRLEQKGYVKSDKTGLAYVYRPTVSRERVSRSRLRNILETFYDGAAGPLVLQLMRDEKLSAQDIAALQKQIDGMDVTSRKRGARR